MSHDFMETISNRRNIRQYSNRKVNRKTILHILEAGRWAPSAHNKQPWRFIVITKKTTKQHLAESMATIWKRDMEKNGIPPHHRNQKIQKSINTFAEAPVIIIVCLAYEEKKNLSSNKREEREYIMQVQSVAAAIENILLAAHTKGVGSGWFCAPLFCQEEVRKTLEIPEIVDPQALITIGYPKVTPSKSPRRPLKTSVYFEKWREKK